VIVAATLIPITSDQQRCVIVNRSCRSTQRCSNM
jgi:hypothetical protein